MDPDQIVSSPFDFMRIILALLPHIGLPWHSLQSWGTAIWIDISLFMQLPILHGILPPFLSGTPKRCRSTVTGHTATKVDLIDLKVMPVRRPRQERHHYLS